jgi:allantoinase
MAEYDLVIRAPRAITLAGEVPRCVGVRNGIVAAVELLEADLTGEQTVQLNDDEVLLPGMVDTHVHVDEPGRTDWEGFETATRAAAAGGITTIIDMPLNSVPPTCTVEALEVKRDAALGKCHIDVGFWGGAIPGNLKDLRGLHDAGVFGFKCFLLHSGVDEFPFLDEDQLEEYLAVLRTYGALMIVHAEDSKAISRAPDPYGKRYANFLASRPRGAENVAIAHVIEAARYTKARVHLLHLSSSDAVPMIRTARRDGVTITVETCPHYLFFEAESIADGATEFKCCPPIREADNREALWGALDRGDIDCIVSDHSPCTVELKRREVGEFGSAWGGISSLEVALSAVWTQARLRGYTLIDVVRWMAERPAQIAGLHGKGRIERGYHADFTVFAPNEAFVVDPSQLHHRNPVTPYANRPLAGVVRSTWLRGQQVTGDNPLGHLISRGEA